MTFHATYTILKMIGLSALLFFLCISPAGAGGEPQAIEITSIVWEWQHTLYNNDTTMVPGDPGHYTVVFEPNGKVSLRADCNLGGGSYSVEGKRIAIKVTHTTRAMCPPDSLEQAFIKNLNAASIYFFKKENLYLDLKYDTGTMKLSH